MTITYPLAVPTVNVPKAVRFRTRSVVGQSESPFTGELQVYAHQGEILSLEAQLPSMERADAEEWVAWRMALNGREGTFLIGDPVNTTPRGTWAGALPLVHGPNQTGRYLNVDGLAAFLAAAAGDWIQLGTGLSARLHKVLQAVTFDSGGEGTLALWPRIVTAPADNASVVLANTVGCFRLLDNDQEWTIEEAQAYGLTFGGRQEI